VTVQLTGVVFIRPRGLLKYVNMFGIFNEIEVVTWSLDQLEMYRELELSGTVTVEQYGQINSHRGWGTS